jgi:HPt (histidine-containing phosphotransfer) domain-containing protein
VIDWDRVRDLYDEIGADAFAEVLDLFVLEVDDAIARLRAATLPDARSNEFHFLKGAALNLGLGQIAALCAQGEKAAAAGQDTGQMQAQVACEFPALNAVLSRDWPEKFGVL